MPIILKKSKYWFVTTLIRSAVLKRQSFIRNYVGLNEDTTLHDELPGGIVLCSPNSATPLREKK
jgi:hypothetical protein